MFIFKNKKLFTLVFLILFLIDFWTKKNMPLDYRYVTKGALYFSLLLFFIVNKKGIAKNLYVVVGLILCFIGEMFVINIDYAGQEFVFYGMVCIALSKSSLCLKVANKNDFKFSELIPITIIYGFTLVIIFGFILSNLKGFFIPVLLYYIISLITGLFVYLRKGLYSARSFYLVVLGCLLYFVGENVSSISLFTEKLTNDFFMLNYVLVVWGLYFVVLGILFEKDPVNRSKESSEYLM